MRLRYISLLWRRSLPRSHEARVAGNLASYPLQLHRPAISDWFEACIKDIVRHTAEAPFLAAVYCDLTLRCACAMPPRIEQLTTWQQCGVKHTRFM